MPAYLLLDRHFENGDPKRTPQQITPGQRRTWGKVSRAKEIRRQADQLIVAHSAHAERLNAMGLQAPSGLDLVAAAETMLGKPYRITGCRCEQGCCCEDCSGLYCQANNMVGLPHICTTSFALAISAREEGRIVSFDEAIHTPGMLLIRGPHNGEGPANGPRGSNGHIVICKGDGATTVEAMGTAYGIVRGSVFRRGFDDPTTGRPCRAAGIDYSVPVPKEEPVLFLDKVHHGKPSRSRSASVQPNGDIWLGNGANLHGAKPQVVLGIRLVRPPANAADFLGGSEAGPNGFTLQFLQKDGSFADFHYDFAA